MSERRTAAIDDEAVKHRRSAYLLALQLLRDPEEARDVAQEAIVRFYGNLKRFRGGSDVKPWLLKISRNLALDVFRRRKTRRKEPADVLERTASVDSGPEAALADREKQARVWKAVCGLDDIHREIILLRDYHDLSYAEIARILSVPGGTVMSRLHNARMKLREVLIEEE